MKWLKQVFRKAPPIEKALPPADVMKEALDRLNDAVKHTKECEHLTRVARVYDANHDEVMCLECGLIRLLSRHSTSNYSDESDIPEVLENWQKADTKNKE